ncbi:MAG: helix-hairpin-helix domain-containing protein [Dehalococcoidia bacterium]
MVLVAATVAAVLAAVVLLAGQDDNATIQIIAPQEVAAQVTASSQTPSQSPLGGLIDLNLASAGLLETLPGIGPALAEAIVAYRENVRLFQSVSEVQEVPKIGPVTYQNIKDLVAVSGGR